MDPLAKSHYSLPNYNPNPANPPILIPNEKIDFDKIPEDSKNMLIKLSKKITKLAKQIENKN